MKRYLYWQWIEEAGSLRTDMSNLEEEFRSKGCPTCGPAKEGNGQWIAHGGIVLTCPHLERFISNRFRDRIKNHRLLLSYISSDTPDDVLLLFNSTSSVSVGLRNGFTSEGRVKAACNVSKPL